MVDGEQLVDSSAIIDKSGHTIIPEKMAVSAYEDDEETNWRRYGIYSITYVYFFQHLLLTFSLYWACIEET
ncbi:hypothetical protein Patl1_19610 [Pistacia atlantica]|uniref:Uncharacterized protein n=1 Tax=Pistacia atlantica TaxID=434234 RepID=A0ACC1C3F4_9ROSI|nr:hypothetical protein Patl1_19610 [Pistacia atlantica]